MNELKVTITTTLVSSVNCLTLSNKVEDIQILILHIQFNRKACIWCTKKTYTRMFLQQI